MRKLVLIVAALLGLPASPQAAYFQGQTYLIPVTRGDVICDITTGVATGIGAGTCVANPATCDGVANDAQAFADFNSWANLTWQASHSGLVELYIPPGKTCLLSTDVTLTASSFDPGCATPSTYGFDCSWGSGRWAKGIRRFLMNFSGASVSKGGSVILFLGAGDGVCHRGITQGNGCSARTATASIGATSVTLLDTSLCSRFTAGNYVAMTGYDTQGIYSPTGGYGYPPNPAFYDYAVVTSTASCAGSGVINLDRALTNDYKSTWPLNCPGSAFEADCGGPATLYALPFWWNTEVEYRGGTLNNGSNQTNGQGRSILYTNVTWTGGVNCTYPSQAISWAVFGGDWSACTIELDKIVVNASMQGTSVFKLKSQSMSPRYFTTNNMTVAEVQGTSRNVTMNNTTVTSAVSDFQFGTTGFGRADTFTGNNLTVSSPLGYIGARDGGTVSGSTWGLAGQAGGPYNSTMANGIITIPNTHGAVTWAVPGTNFTWNIGSVASVYVYQVLDVTQDATNQYVTTNCVGSATVCGAGGGLPASSGSLTAVSHPSPKFNCTNCSGTRIWSAVSNGPVDAPLFSYQKFTADVSWPTAANNAYKFGVWGELSSMVATVNSPYGGAGTLGFRPTGQFVYTVYSNTGSSGSYVPLIDLKTGGTRTITSSGCTGCGGADASTAYTFTPQWMAGVVSPVISSQPAWTGTIDITITTNQGVVNP